LNWSLGWDFIPNVSSTSVQAFGCTFRPIFSPKISQQTQPASASWAVDIAATGNQAYQNYIDRMRENEEVTATTTRICHSLNQTHQIADSINEELVAQNEQMEHIQNEQAEVQDKINTCEKIQNSLDSWNPWVNLGSKKTHNQHQKLRTKEEAAYAKQNSKNAQVQAKQQVVENKIAVKQNSQNISQHVEDHKKEIQAGKKESMATAKDITKHRVEQQEGQFVSGGQLFEMRVEGSGPKCLAEEQVDQICRQTAGLVDKALIQQQLLEQSRYRAGRIENEMEVINPRLEACHIKADRYCGKK